jgi:hypothetical protein
MAWVPWAGYLSEHVLMLRPLKAMQLCSDPQPSARCRVAALLDRSAPCGSSFKQRRNGPAPVSRLGVSAPAVKHVCAGFAGVARCCMLP